MSSSPLKIMDEKTQQKTKSTRPQTRPDRIDGIARPKAPRPFLVVVAASTRDARVADGLMADGGTEPRAAAEDGRGRGVRRSAARQWGP